MIELTPLDKTVAGQELIRMGLEMGREEGRLIGNTQRVLGLPITPEKTLARKGVQGFALSDPKQGVQGFALSEIPTAPISRKFRYGACKRDKSLILESGTVPC